MEHSQVLEKPKDESLEGGTYYLTMDLGEKLDSLARLGLPVPGAHSTLVTDIQTELIDTIRGALPNTRIEPQYVQDMAGNIIGATQGILKDFRHPVAVSSCPEITVPSGGLSVDVNRIIDEEGAFIGYGPRPGAKPVSQQIQDMRRSLVGRDVVIVEDGIFTGGTIKYLISEFEKQGHRIGAVVAGFSCDQSDRSWFDQKGYRVETVLGSEHIKEWVPDHDFLPFVPGSGKVVGTEIAGWVHPFYDHGHASYSKPYIRPYGDAENWASIPEDQVGAVSVKGIELAIELYRAIGNARPDREPVRIGEVILARQRCSIPMEFTPPKLVDHDQAIVDNLQDYLRCQS